MRGFWSGLIFGVILSVAVALALSLAFPAFVFYEPKVETKEAPDRPSDPLVTALPETPGLAAEEAAPRKVVPLIETDVTVDNSPGLAATAPAPAPDVFDGAGAGSPSLVFPSAAN